MEAMHLTTEAALKDKLRIDFLLEHHKETPDFVKEFTQLNWSIGLSSFLEQGQILLLMTDLDSLVINSELARPESERQKIMLL